MLGTFGEWTTNGPFYHFVCPFYQVKVIVTQRYETNKRMHMSFAQPPSESFRLLWFWTRSSLLLRVSKKEDNLQSDCCKRERERNGKKDTGNKWQRHKHFHEPREIISKNGIPISTHFIYNLTHKTKLSLVAILLRYCWIDSDSSSIEW